MTGAFTGEPFAGGLKFEEPGVPTLISPDINPNTPGSRIYGWSQQDFIKRVRMGKLISYTHMPWNSFKRMSDNDLKAVYNYLKSLPGIGFNQRIPSSKKGIWIKQKGGLFASWRTTQPLKTKVGP